jgi:hypothetical protein
MDEPSNHSRDVGTQKEIFDRISLNMISYLDQCEEVAVVELQSGNSKNVQNEISIWEKKNFPYKIPVDMKALYSCFNGLT